MPTIAVKSVPGLVTQERMAEWSASHSAWSSACGLRQGFPRLASYKHAHVSAVIMHEIESLLSHCMTVRNIDGWKRIKPYFEPFLYTYLTYFSYQSAFSQLGKDTKKHKKILKSVKLILGKRLRREVFCMSQMVVPLLSMTVPEIQKNLKYRAKVMMNKCTKNRDSPPDPSGVDLFKLRGIVRCKVNRLLSSKKSMKKAVSFCRSVAKAKILWPELSEDFVQAGAEKHLKCFTRENKRINETFAFVLKTSASRVFRPTAEMPWRQTLPNSHACLENGRKEGGNAGPEYLTTLEFTDSEEKVSWNLDYCPHFSSVLFLQTTLETQEFYASKYDIFYPNYNGGVDCDTYTMCVCCENDRIRLFSESFLEALPQETPVKFIGCHPSRAAKQYSEDPTDRKYLLPNEADEKDRRRCENIKHRGPSTLTRPAPLPARFDWFVRTKRILTSDYNTCARMQHLHSLGKTLASAKTSDLFWIGLKEPAKIRSISKMNGHAANTLLPLQKNIIDCWKDQPQSTMRETDLTARVQQLVDANPDCPLLVSIDYESATDLVERFSTYIQLLEIDDPLIPLAIKTFLPGFTTYETERGRESHPTWNGQPMGHVLSFPLLCNLNLSVLKSTCLIYQETHCEFGLNCLNTHFLKHDFRHTMDAVFCDSCRSMQRVVNNAIINGDDICFKAPTEEFVQLFYVNAREFGLQPSPGKQFLTMDYITLNSQDFAVKEGKVTRIGYLNQTWRQINTFEKAYRFHTGEDVTQIHDTMVAFCPWAREIIPQIYKKIADIPCPSQFPGFRPNLFIPKFLGGLGFRFPGDPEEFEEKVRITRPQRLMMAHFLDDPTLGLLGTSVQKTDSDWNGKYPFSTPGPASTYILPFETVEEAEEFGHHGISLKDNSKGLSGDLCQLYRYNQGVFEEFKIQKWIDIPRQRRLKPVNLNKSYYYSYFAKKFYGKRCPHTGIELPKLQTFRHDDFTLKTMFEKLLAQGSC